MKCLKNVHFELAAETVNLERGRLVLGVKHAIASYREQQFS